MESLFVFLRSELSYEKFVPLMNKPVGINIFYFHDETAISKATRHHKPSAYLVHEADYDEFCEIASATISGNIESQLILVRSSETITNASKYSHISTLSPDFTDRELEGLLNTGRGEKVTEGNNCNLLYSIVQQIPVAVFWKDRNLNFLGCNQVFCNYNNLTSPAEVEGLSDFELFPGEIAVKNREADLAVIESGEARINYEEQQINHEGNVEILRKSKIPIKNDAGQIVAVLGIYERITEQVNVREHLANEQHYLQMLMDNIPDTIYFKNRDSAFVRINRSQATVIGVSATAEAVGKTDFDFFDRKHALQAFEDEQELMKNGIPVLNKLERLKTAHGYRYMSSSKIPLKDDTGTCIGMVGISRDVTEEQRMQNEIKKEQELLRLLMDNMPDRIYFKDSKSRFVRVNKAHCQSNGIENPNKIIGKTDFDLYEEEIANEKFELEKEILKTGIPMIGKLEKKYMTNGSPAWSSSTKVPIRNEKGEITGLVGISRDVTLQELARQELQHAKEKAEEANKAKSMFLANMSHEIRTPMNGVIGMADILKRTKLDLVQREYLDIIMKSGQTLLAIINDILDFSKIESGKLQLEAAPVNIRTVVEEVADVQAIQAGNNGIDFLTFVDPAIPEYVTSDYVRLKQVLTNLANNAVKFTSKGEVCITAELLVSNEGKHEILFSVRDTGIGIAAENQQKLFQSFTQVDSSTTRKFGGTGLGLAISKRLINSMGGDIVLESEEGKGSVFSFSLKLRETQGERNGFMLRNISFKDLNALVVDDNQTSRLVFREYLESWGVNVHEAVDGFDALTKLQKIEKDQLKLDFALLDFQMAEMDGKELARQIKQNTHFSGLKLILASSVTDAVSRSNLKQSDFDFYLNKPLKLEKLYQAISATMGSESKVESERDESEILQESFRHKKIMIVEDNLVNMKVAEHSLKNFCPGLTLAYNGQEAVNLFKPGVFDYILMDIQMPVMNGIEATKRIREIEESQFPGSSKTRIIAMTANTMKEDVEYCLQIGMDAFLGKPFKLEDLLDAIEI